MSEAQTTKWTTRLLLDWMTNQFTSREIENPRLIGEMLLSHVLGDSRIDLYANADRVANENERTTLRELVKRALKHEPVQYIVGNAWFFGIELQVNDSTLIPRSCTERMVEQAIEFCKTSLPNEKVRIADIGTGTGCIAITLAANMPEATIVATDISLDALELTQTNALLHKVDTQISCIEGDGVTPLLNLDPFDVICSNPPYIPVSELAELDTNVIDWEPKSALCGGVEGLDVISSILRDAPKILNPEGLLIIEIASSTREKSIALAQAQGDFQDVKIIRDAYGDDRFLRAIRRA